MPDSKEDNPLMKIFEETQLIQTMAAVSLSLPSFWPQNPDAWFAKVKAQFRVSKITVDETRYYRVLAVLPESAVIRVREITQKPLYEEGDYAKLKQKLIAGCQPSTLQRLDQLGEMKCVSHKKPSETLLDLESVFHSATAAQVMPMNEYMKKFWWLRALPKSIQQTLIPVAETTALDNLVIIADQMYSSNPPIVADVHLEPQSSGSTVDKSGSLDALLDDTGDEPSVAALSRRDRYQRSQKREVLFCKYHAKFGDQAKRCVVGCYKYKSQPKN